MYFCEQRFGCLERNLDRPHGESMPTKRKSSSTKLLVVKELGEVRLMIWKHGVVRKLEIKFANLNRPMANSEMRRWVWAHMLGRESKKRFDRLILVAPHDPQFRSESKDPESPWVIFDVPFAEVPSLAERDGTIWTGTHPTKFRRSTHRRLICDYQVTRDELKQRYRHEEER